MMQNKASEGAERVENGDLRHTSLNSYTLLCPSLPDFAWLCHRTCCCHWDSLRPPVAVQVMPLAACSNRLCRGRTAPLMAGLDARSMVEWRTLV